MNTGDSMETTMLKLNSQYKEINKQPEQLKISNDEKQLPVNNNQPDFRTQFKTIRQSYQRTDEQRMLELKEQCVQMENELVKIMVNQMYKTINKTDFIHGGQGEELFREMLNEQYAESLTRNTSLGIADSMFSQITGLYR